MMWKPISKNAHGIIDYSYGVVIPILPEAAGFNNVVPAKNLCRALGAGAITYTLLTRAKWGIFPLLPFRKHLIIDTALSLAAIAAPWLLRFSGNSVARNILIGIGAAGLAAAVLTDSMEHEDTTDNYLFI